MRRRPPRTMAAAMLLAALVLSSCAVGRGAAQPPEQRVRRALLSVPDVAAIPDAPVGLEEASAAAMGMLDKYQSVQGVGPCGAPLARPSTAPGDRATVLFLSQQSLASVEHIVYRLPPGAAEQYLGKLRADTRPGCPPARADVPGGVRMVVEFRGALALPPLGDDRLAMWTVDRLDDGTEVHVMMAMVRVGASLTTVGVLSSAGAPSQAFLADLAVVAADKLAKAKLG